MDWRKEPANRLTKQMQLVYIESELMNYYWHLSEWRRYDQLIRELRARYQEELEHPGCGSSIIRMPDGSSQRSPWQIEWSGKLHQLRKKQKVEEMYLDRVDQWLTVCSSSQEAMIRQYVMVQQCTNAELAAEITGYSADNIKKTRERVLNLSLIHI